MTRIVPVRLRYNPKALWFDPGDLEIASGDQVIVSTEKGDEFGTAETPCDVEYERVKALKSPLKPVVRIATDEDRATLDELAQKGEDALPVFRRLAAKTNPDMKPVMVEYLFGGEKAVFFFEAESRQDFRELTRKLSDELGIRADLRMIGLRDQARLVGGLGHCGQELCCSRLGGDFCSVSIRMAKEQDLSLNPEKISGACGRLMCCLRYEFDSYKDFKSRAPKANARITTPAGDARVRNLDMPRERVTIRMEDGGKQIVFPLSAFEKPEEGRRPHVIGEEEFERWSNPEPLAETETVLGVFNAATFTGNDKLGRAEAVHNPRSKKKPKASTSGTGNDEQGTTKRRRRRRSGSGSDKANGNERRDTSKTNAGKQSSKKQQPAKNGPRPGQKSSALRKKGTDTADAPAASTHRKTRRRSHKTGGDAK